MQASLERENENVCPTSSHADAQESEDHELDHEGEHGMRHIWSDLYQVLLSEGSCEAEVLEKLQLEISRRDLACLIKIQMT